MLEAYAVLSPSLSVPLSHVDKHPALLPDNKLPPLVRTVFVPHLISVSAPTSEKEPPILLHCNLKSASSL